MSPFVRLPRGSYEIILPTYQQIIVSGWKQMDDSTVMYRTLTFDGPVDIVQKPVRTFIDLDAGDDSEL